MAPANFENKMANPFLSLPPIKKSSVDEVLEIYTEMPMIRNMYAIKNRYNCMIERFS